MRKPHNRTHPHRGVGVGPLSVAPMNQGSSALRLYYPNNKIGFNDHLILKSFVKS